MSRASSLFLFESLQRPGLEFLLIVSDNDALIISLRAVRKAGALDVPREALFATLGRIGDPDPVDRVADVHLSDIDSKRGIAHESGVAIAVADAWLSLVQALFGIAAATAPFVWLGGTVL